MLTIVKRHLRGGHRRLQIGHGETSSELRSGVLQDGGGGWTVAKMVMKVVGEGYG